MTLTFVEFAQATYRASPFGDSTSSVGCSAVGHVVVNRFLSRSSTATAARFHRLTNARLPPGSMRQVYGKAPRSFAAGSAFFALSLASGSLRPSGGLAGSPFAASFRCGGWEV